jgi:hypothetical protein
VKLTHHTFAEWAEVIKRRLLALGCSVEYAEAEARRIREAEPK